MRLNARGSSHVDPDGPRTNLGAPQVVRRQNGGPPKTQRKVEVGTHDARYAGRQASDSSARHYLPRVYETQAASRPVTIALRYPLATEQA